MKTLAFLLMMSTASMAQEAICASFGELDATLRRDHGEWPAATFESPKDRSIKFFFYMNIINRTSTIIKVIGDDACIMQSGWNLDVANGAPKEDL